MVRRYETCPYNSIPPTARWADAVASIGNNHINPHTEAAFQLDSTMRIASAGSCFAQNLSRVLQASGFNYYCTEPAPAWLSEEERAAYSYGTFSARYGNIYTPRQLLQLLHRALGRFTPQEPAWVSGDGRVFDPFRPRIQPKGFDSIDEMIADRNAHLEAVRELVETLDVLVFTLGLTEAWRSRLDGAVFPVAPGCGAGEFDPERHEFHNLRVSETISDLDEAVSLLHAANPKARVILTVSPVALQATMTDRHVLQATVYSKSVLRTAAEELALAHANVSYFASYEIVTATLNNAAYFAADKRNVTEGCVDHVMRSFFDLYAPGTRGVTMAEAKAVALPVAPAASAPVNVICDEDAIIEALAAQVASGGPAA
jgi:hypothetical protein